MAKHKPDGFDAGYEGLLPKLLFNMSASAVCFLDSSALLSEVCAQSDKLPDYDVTALHLAAYHGKSTDAAQLL